MATIIEDIAIQNERQDHLSGTPRASFIDRWIYFLTAAIFIAVILTGFIPDSLAKIAAANAGLRPPFPFILHVHAVLMGSFLLLLLAQTWLVAVGKTTLHQSLGIASFLIAPAIVVAGFILIPTIYGSIWHAAQTAPPQVQPELKQLVGVLDNIMLLQLRVGVLFPLFLWIGLRARVANPGFHKRMIILATATTLGAGIDRITWLPTTFPGSPLSTDAYTLLAVAPMFVWDVMRNRSVHPAYLVWIAISLPFAILINVLWNTTWWHSMAPRLMGL